MCFAVCVWVYRVIKKSSFVKLNESWLWKKRVSDKDRWDKKRNKLKIEKLESWGKENGNGVETMNQMCGYWIVIYMLLNINR